MKEFLMKMVPVELSDQFPFQCKRCGACCRYVKQSVPLEPLDVFRLAKYLKKQRKGCFSMDEVLFQYAEPVLLHESGYMVFMLKTIGSEDACIFLQDNQCGIHEVNPRACRTYPLSVGPDMHGGSEQYLSMEQPGHFRGTIHSVKKWVQKYCSDEEWKFWNLDMESVKELAQLLEAIPECEKSRALLLFIMYRYSDFDLEQPFFPQFERNHQKLLHALRNMAGMNEK